MIEQIPFNPLFVQPSVAVPHLVPIHHIDIIAQCYQRIILKHVNPALAFIDCCSGTSGRSSEKVRGRTCSLDLVRRFHPTQV
jgi:hypothetical protein